MKTKKNVIIAGGTSGIGLAIAKRLSCDSSINVCIVGKSNSKLQKIAAEIGCLTYRLNLTEYNEIKKFAQWVKNNFAHLDCIISSVGTYLDGELDLTNPSDLVKTIEVNFTGNVLLFKFLIPILKQQKNSQIIYINSGMGLKPHPGKSVYSASKWAMTGLMKSLELELARYGIRVTSLYPNKTKTDIFSKAQIDMDESNALDATEIARTVEFILKLDNETVISDLSIKQVRHSAKAKFKKIKYKDTFVLERVNSV